MPDENKKDPYGSFSLDKNSISDSVIFSVLVAWTGLRYAVFRFSVL